MTRIAALGLIIAAIAFAGGLVVGGRFQVAGTAENPIKIDRLTGTVWVWDTYADQYAKKKYAGLPLDPANLGSAGVLAELRKMAAEGTTAKLAPDTVGPDAVSAPAQGGYAWFKLE